MANVSALDWEWEWIGDCYAANGFLINGVDVFQYKWIPVKDCDYIRIVNGNHNQHFTVYFILAGEKKIVFATGELSNNVYGFCRRIMNSGSLT